jgi:D-beta-D-heptose 7-phosphate kinase / D-beta-D-heptose 1-phosphate adenosyltransferase
MTMADLLSRFAGVRVVVVGDAILDEYLSGDCSRLSPEAPVPVLGVTGTRHTLGGAANTAANVASLGGRATLLSLVGDDAAGEALASRCRQSGVDLLPVRDGRPTLRKARVVGQHQQLVRLDYEDDNPIRPETEPAVLVRYTDALRDADIVVVSDYAKGLLTERVCRQIIDEAHAAGREVVIDPRPQHRGHYLHCDYLTPNWKESLGLIGEPDAAPAPERVESVGRRLASAIDTNLIMTLGASGMVFFGRDGAEHFALPTLAREVFDVSGAGDTVVAAFALARAAGGDHAAAVGLANAAAGVVVGKFGTATVSAEELQAASHEPARLVARGELAGLVARLRQSGKRIVTINGSFDLLHAGHLHILREASKQGDVLIVGLNSDSSVRAYKGPTRPILTQRDRAEMLLALRWVDFVHVFDELVPMPFLEETRPDVHVNGAEYGEECIEAATVTRLGGRLHIVERIAGLSTTELIASMKPGG